MRHICLAILLSVFSFSAFAGSQQQSAEREAEVKITLSNTIKGYKSLVLNVHWTRSDRISKRAMIIFHPERKLPSKLKYVVVQNQKDRLTSVDNLDFEILAKAAERIDREHRYHAKLVALLALLRETPTVDADYFSRRGEKNWLADDGVVWAAGWYTKRNGQLNVVLTPVGDSATQCYGRKGPKCGKPKFSREALNHDICHRIEGDNFTGACKMEFVDAVIGRSSRNILKALF